MGSADADGRAEGDAGVALGAGDDGVGAGAAVGDGIDARSELRSPPCVGSGSVCVCVCVCVMTMMMMMMMIMMMMTTTNDDDHKMYIVVRASRQSSRPRTCFK